MIRNKLQIKQKTYEAFIGLAFDLHFLFYLVLVI